MNQSKSKEVTNWSKEEFLEIQSLLEQKLSLKHISNRPGSNGMSVPYVESWKSIELANAVFGFNGWSSSIVDITPDFVDHEQGYYKVGVTAVVRVVLKDGTYHEDVGYGMNKSSNKGQAIENAKKEAVSDARKRALRVFGNFLGNSVYDRVHITAEKANEKTKLSNHNNNNPQPLITYSGIRSNIKNNILNDAKLKLPQDDSRSLTQTSHNVEPPVNMAVGFQEVNDIYLNDFIEEEGCFLQENSKYPCNNNNSTSIFPAKK